MAKVGKPFEKGNTLGKGRPSMPAWVKETRSMTQETFTKALNDICRFSTENVRDIANDESLPIKSSIMAHWLLAARVDPQSREHLLNRLYGKPKETVDINLNGIVSRMSDDDLLLACRDALKIVEEEKQLLHGGIETTQ